MEPAPSRLGPHYGPPRSLPTAAAAFNDPPADRCIFTKIINVHFGRLLRRIESWRCAGSTQNSILRPNMHFWSPHCVSIEDTKHRGLRSASPSLTWQHVGPPHRHHAFGRGPQWTVGASQMDRQPNFMPHGKIRAHPGCQKASPG